VFTVRDADEPQRRDDETDRVRLSELSQHPHRLEGWLPGHRLSSRVGGPNARETDELATTLVVPKSRDGETITEPITMEIADRVQIDTSRNIA
jgi:hypothetical protein